MKDENLSIGSALSILGEVDNDAFQQAHKLTREDWLVETRKIALPNGEFMEVETNRWKLDALEAHIKAKYGVANADSETALMPAPISEIGDTDVTTTTASTEKPSLELLTAEIKMYLQIANQSIIEVGKRLIAAKEMLPHGQWLNWLHDNFNLKERMARNFMEIFRRFSERHSNAEVDFSTFNQSQLIALLALPEGEEEKFIEAKAAAGTPVEDMTVKKLRDEIKNYKADLQKLTAERDNFQQSTSNLEKQLANRDSELRDAKTRADNLSTQLANQKPVEVIPADYESLKKEVAELRDRPVEVATEYPADYASTKKELAEFKARENSFQRDYTISQTLSRFLSALPALLNAVNLQSGVTLLAERDAKTLKERIEQLPTIHTELQNYLQIWEAYNNKPVDRNAIIDELKQMMWEDKSNQTSAQFLQWINDWGYQTVSQVPDDKLSDLLIMARERQKSLSPNN